MSPSPVNIKILADAQQAIAQFQTVNTELGKMDVATLKAGGSITQMDKANRLASATMAAMGVGVAAFAFEAVKSAMASQNAFSTLGQALANTGNGSAVARDQISKLIDAQAKLGFGSIETANAYSSLITATGSQTESTKLLTLAEDLARFKHEDLGTAATTLDRATQGSVKAFKELGITLDANLPKNQAIAKAMDELNAKIGGQATAYTKNFSGQISVLTAEAKLFAEQVGMKLIPILQDLMAFFQKFGPAILTIGGAILVTVAAFKAYTIIMDVAKAAQIVYIAVTGGVAAAQTALTFATNAGKESTAAFAAVQAGLNAIMAANPIAIVILAVAALAAGFVILWNHSKSFRDIIIDAMKAAVIGVGWVIGAVGDLVTAFLKFESGPLRLLLEGLSHLPFVGGAAKDALKVLNAGIADVGNFFDNAKSSIDGYASSLDSLANKKFTLPNLLGGGVGNIPGMSAGGGGSVGVSGNIPGGNIAKIVKSSSGRSVSGSTSAINGAALLANPQDAYQASMAAYVAGLTPSTPGMGGPRDTSNYGGVTVTQNIRVDGSTAPIDIANAAVQAIKYGGLAGAGIARGN